MAAPSTIATALFTVSAALHAAAVPGHAFFGFKHLDPVLHSLSDSYAHRLAAVCANGSWDHMQIGIIAGAVLNWRWSKTGGPKELDEKVIFFSLLAGGLYAGKGMWALGQYRPLLVLWLAPVLSTLAWLVG